MICKGIETNFIFNICISGYYFESPTSTLQKTPTATIGTHNTDREMKQLSQPSPTANTTKRLRLSMPLTVKTYSNLY